MIYSHDIFPSFHLAILPFISMNDPPCLATAQGLHAELQFSRYEAALSKLTFLKRLVKGAPRLENVLRKRGEKIENIWDKCGIYGKYQNGIYGKYLGSIWDTWIYLEKYWII
jgi:hypothetical protein